MQRTTNPGLNIIRILFALMLIAGTGRTYSQSSTTSPYSSYGIGERYFSGLNYNTGFGFGGSALDSNLHVNILNPAAMSGLQYATFEGSVASRQMFYKDQKNSSFKRNTTLDHLVFGLPIKKRAGVYFGLTPYTSIGVNQSDTVDMPGFGKLNFLNIDSGGVTRGMIGAGIGAGKFSFGVEGNYLFGNIQRQRELIILEDPAALGLSRVVYTKLSGVSMKAGVHFKTFIRNGYRDTIPDSLKRFRHKLKEKINGTRIAFSAVYEPGTMLNGETTMSTYTFNQVAAGRSNLKNVEFVPKIPGTFYLPQGGSVGMAVNKGKWTTVADFNYHQWSSFRSFEPKDTILENGEASFSGSDSLTDSWRVSAGVQYHPDFTSNKFFMQGKYRLGAYYGNTGLHVNGIDITEYGVTLGWGIPLKRAYANGPIPGIEASVAIGERGSLTNDLTRERFITARIGLTISDRWFVRRKFD